MATDLGPLVHCPLAEINEVSFFAQPFSYELGRGVTVDGDAGCGGCFSEKIWMEELEPRLLRLTHRRKRFSHHNLSLCQTRMIPDENIPPSSTVVSIVNSGGGRRGLLLSVTAPRLCAVWQTAQRLKEASVTPLELPTQTVWTPILLGCA